MRSTSIRLTSKLKMEAIEFLINVEMSRKLQENTVCSQAKFENGVKIIQKSMRKLSNSLKSWRCTVGVPRKNLIWKSHSMIGFRKLDWLKNIWYSFPIEIVKNSFTGCGYAFEDRINEEWKPNLSLVSNLIFDYRKWLLAQEAHDVALFLRLYIGLRFYMSRTNFLF